MAIKFRKVRADKGSFGIGIGFALVVEEVTQRAAEDFANYLADKVQAYADEHGHKTSDVAYDFKTVALASADLSVKNELVPRVTFDNAIAEAVDATTKFDSTPTTEF